MAQQTQIATMIPYFERWIQRFPNLRSLAEADEAAVLKLWEGLGYYSRARNLHKGAQMIMEKFNGVFPQDIDSILSIPGIGDYTANAILSIAFHQPAIAIDGNVIRVMSRYEGSLLDYYKEKNKNALKADLLSKLGDDDPNSFTQALMELGALICTPKKAACEQCPLRESCKAFTTNTVYDYPLKKVRKPNPVESYDVFIVVKKDHLLLAERGDDTLMKGLKRLPQLPHSASLHPEKFTFLFQEKHIYSHRTWIMNVYQTNEIDQRKEWTFYPLSALSSLALIGAHRKLLIRLGLLDAEQGIE